MLDNLNMIATVIGLGTAGGFAVALGLHMGFKLGAYLYGPIKVDHSSTYNVNLPPKIFVEHRRDGDQERK